MTWRTSVSVSSEQIEREFRELAESIQRQEQQKKVALIEEERKPDGHQP